MEIMTAKERAKQDRALLSLLKKWQVIEGKTIESCETILKKSRNPIIKTLSRAIKNDSEKHKSILQLVIDGMTKTGYVLSPDDLADVASLLGKHIALEQKSIDVANQAIGISRDTITTQMLKLILEDEKKHKKMAQQMNDLKFAITGKIT
ncbi:MAG: hypothetical protein HQL08_04460 [Nitrospirae bacterium]|nr:hypothetical protein [Nitrospirota bacterium]